jgi:putative restriction endonuclease
LVIDQEFDGPLFKRLSHNDSGAAPGNQAGFLIPKRFRDFFPALPDPTDEEPAPHCALDAILILDEGAPLLVTTSWQYQSWKNTRPPESRITGKLEPIRKPSREGDLLLIERGVTDSLQYRLTVLRQGTPLYNSVNARTGGKRSGYLEGARILVDDTAVAEAANEIEAQSLAPFEPFEDDAPLQTQVKRVARARAFRNRVVAAYGARCAICGGGVRLPGGVSEIEAAHVIPRAQKGSDDVRNGVALCRTHHWAFDRQLIGLGADGRFRLGPGVDAVPENASLLACAGAPLAAPIDLRDAVHAIAIEWAAAQFDEYWQDHS